MYTSKKNFTLNFSFSIFLFAMSWAVLIIGCAGRTLPPEIRAYDMRVMSQPTVFSMHVEKSEEVWSRAHHFIANLSSFRIQTSTEYVIQTYMMKDSGWPKYGYSVTRTISGSNVNFVVKGFSTNRFDGDNASYNAHALAHYMVTGELIEQRVNR